MIRKQAMQVWADAVAGDPDRLSLGRRGTALSSGEDNDINLTLLRDGRELAYLPRSTENGTTSRRANQQRNS